MHGAYLFRGARGLAAGGLQLLMVAILTFLLLTTGDMYKRKLVKLADPRLADKKITLEVIKRIDHQIERYLIARATISGIVGVATGAAMAFIGVSHPFV